MSSTPSTRPEEIEIQSPSRNNTDWISWWRALLDDVIKLSTGATAIQLPLICLGLARVQTLKNEIAPGILLSNGSLIFYVMMEAIKVPSLMAHPITEFPSQKEWREKLLRFAAEGLLAVSSTLQAASMIDILSSRFNGDTAMVRIREDSVYLDDWSRIVPGFFDAFILRGASFLLQGLLSSTRQDLNAASESLKIGFINILMNAFVGMKYGVETYCYYATLLMGLTTSLETGKALTEAFQPLGKIGNKAANLTKRAAHWCGSFFPSWKSRHPAGAKSTSEEQVCLVVTPERPAGPSKQS